MSKTTLRTILPTAFSTSDLVLPQISPVAQAATDNVKRFLALLA